VDTHPFILVSDRSSTVESVVPEGFVRAPIGGAFALHNGPLYARWRDAKLELASGRCTSSRPGLPRRHA
jgi:hypothetical protein